MVRGTSELDSSGNGMSACTDCYSTSPGRFFSINEVKAMLAYVLLNYDVKIEGGERPKTLWLGTANIPNQTAHLLFRRRKQQ